MGPQGLRVNIRVLFPEEGGTNTDRPEPPVTPGVLSYSNAAESWDHSRPGEAMESRGFLPTPMPTLSRPES